MCKGTCILLLPRLTLSGLQIKFTQLPAEAAVQSLLPGCAWGGEDSGGGGSGGGGSGYAAVGQEGAEAGALGALLLALGRAAWFVGGRTCAIRRHLLHSAHVM